MGTVTLDLSLTTERSNLILHRKWKYSIRCLSDVVLQFERDLSKDFNFPSKIQLDHPGVLDGSLRPNTDRVRSGSATRYQSQTIHDISPGIYRKLPSAAATSESTETTKRCATRSRRMKTFVLKMGDEKFGRANRSHKGGLASPF